jgi:hypothetical protein
MGSLLQHLQNAAVIVLDKAAGFVGDIVLACKNLVA